MSNALIARGRLTEAVRSRWPAGRAGQALLALVILGLVLRALAVASLWPVTILEDNYQAYAKSNPFLDPLHPAGYALILGAIGAVTHHVIVAVVLQHLVAIGAALLLWGATRRVTGSAWTGLLPAGIVLLSGDEIYLEHSIMSETWELLATSVGLYAAVRSLDEPQPWTRWPLFTGAALAIAVTIREASLLLIVVPIVALLIGWSAVTSSWRIRWQAALAVAGAAAAILLAYASASATFGNRFAIAPSPGWYLYSRVAQFADCRRFTPPAGTRALCQTIPPSQRPNEYYYMFIRQASPALREFGTVGNDDGLVGGWARRGLAAQFGDFLALGWANLRSYYLPSSLPARLGRDGGLDPGLSFTHRGNPIFAAAALLALQDFFNRFTTHRVEASLHVLRGWQLVIRFGATVLFVATLLTFVGVVIGTRRSRVGVLLFGLGGLVLLVAPAFTTLYTGRYTVPSAAPLMAAAAITITEMYRAYGRSLRNEVASAR